MPYLQTCAQNNRDYIICGDWNIAHKEIDLKNWRGNQKNSGFLPEERAWLDQLFVDGHSLAGCVQTYQSGSRAIHLVVKQRSSLGEKRRLAYRLSNNKHQSER